MNFISGEKENAARRAVSLVSSENPREIQIDPSACFEFVLLFFRSPSRQEYRTPLWAKKIIFPSRFRCRMKFKFPDAVAFSRRMEKLDFRGLVKNAGDKQSTEENKNE